jgi:hypothetical protein
MFIIGNPNLVIEHRKAALSIDAGAQRPSRIRNSPRVRRGLPPIGTRPKGTLIQ